MSNPAPAGLDPRHVRDLLAKALEEPAEKREAFLRDACAGNEPLRVEVVSLLSALGNGGEFFADPTIDLKPATPLLESPGSRIGHYKLLQLIGEGGFGSVYMAEQEHPVRRKVAIKVIKLGMDTKQVIARFDAERQALAMMDHPNIAKVLDAGATDTGRPYFVMELVRGIKLTQYCDQHNLPTADRLRLFVQICQAVQHAHQKGIIHRDLKPSNVLVTLHDGTPVPKIIDFGVAKATQSRLTELTLFTEYHQFIGTPEYMAPEQAEMSGLDVDTRSDVYSLGVILYELLTGTTPLDGRTLRQAGYDRMKQMIREDEPPRPSTRLSTMANDAVSAVATHRHTEPSRLRQMLRGELDWVVMKCLEKDRGHRYESAAAVAQDLQRHLTDEPVLARPSSGLYRLRKFVRRHTVGVSAAAMILLALLAGLATATYGLLAARTERDRAIAATDGEARQRKAAQDARVQAERDRQTATRSELAATAAARQARAINDFLSRMLAAARPTSREDANLTVRELLDRAAKTLDDGALAAERLTEAAVRYTLAESYRSLGAFVPAEHNLKRSLEVREQDLPPDDPAIAATLHAIGNLYLNRRDYPNALDHYTRAIGILQRHPAQERAVASILESMAQCSEDTAEATRYRTQAHAVRERIPPEDSANRAMASYGTAMLHLRRKEYADAERILRLSVEQFVLEFGPHSWNTAYAYNNLGSAILGQRRYPEAQATFERSIAILANVYADDHAAFTSPLRGLVIALDRQGKRHEASAARLRLVRIDLAACDLDLRYRPDDAAALFRRADLRCRAGDFAAALPDFRRAVELDPDEPWYPYPAAIAHLYAGDRDACRRIAAATFERYGGPDADTMAGPRAAKLCLLDPAPVVPLERLAHWIDAPLADPDTPFRAWKVLSKALFELRAGRHASALSILDAPLPGKVLHADVGRTLVRALALHGVGDPAAARTLRDDAARRLADACGEPGKVDLTTEVHNWMVNQLLLRELDAALKANP